MKKIAVFALAIIGTVVLAWCTTKQTDANANGVLDSFAQCVTDKWLKMYGTDWCPHCQNMKKMFGTAFSKIKFINCDEQKIQCDAAGVTGYPTWILNGNQYPGEKTLQELANITQCEAPTVQ